MDKVKKIWTILTKPAILLMISQANKCSQRIFINGSDHFLKTVSKELPSLVCFLLMIDYGRLSGFNKIFSFTHESDLLQKAQ